MNTRCIRSRLNYDRLSKLLPSKQEQLTQLNKEAAALSAELAAGNQAIYLEKKLSRSLQRRIEQLQAVEARMGMLENQAADARARAREAEAELSTTRETCIELRQHNAGLEAQLAALRHASALEQRISQLHQAVFGTDGPAPQTGNDGGKAAS